MTLRYDGTNMNSILGFDTSKYGGIGGAASVGTQGVAGASPNWLSQEGMFGQSGWVMPAAQLGAGALQSFLGLKQLKLAKDMFRQQSAYAATDLANQAKTVNERLETRQNRRLQEGTSTVPVSEFMSKHAVSGKVGG
jgi:CubicO group peptidase (beta-lactamase class C family)